VLNQLKWCSKGKDSFDRPRRSNLHVVVGSFRDVATGWRVAKTFRHLGKGIVGVEETARRRIDESDPTGHVRKHFLVEDHFTFQPPLGFQLALVIRAAQPRKDRGENDQPGSQYSHSSQKVMNRFVSQGPRLLHHGHPTAGFNRAERVKITVPLEMSALALADFFD